MALGATRADVGQDGSETWVVLADPEGNEFCVLSTRSAAPAESRTPAHGKGQAYGRPGRGGRRVTATRTEGRMHACADGRRRTPRPRGRRDATGGASSSTPLTPALARFYAILLGWEIAKAEPAWAAIGPADGVAYLAFQTAPEYERPAWPSADGAQQMMMHLDFQVDDLAAAVAHAVDLGAEEAQHQPQPDVRVLLDPAGHPFCLYLDTES